MAPSEQNSDADARRLMLERLVAAPEAWRGRATAAGGFLGAAAAVSLWGLSNNSDRLDGAARFFAFVASVSYVAAVVAFLAASVWRSPEAESSTTTDFSESTRAYVVKEARPVRRLVHAGAYAAGTAVISTAVCSFMILGDPDPRHVQISVPDPQQQRALARLCPGLPDPFDASVVDNGSGEVRVKVQGRTCGKSKGTTFILQAGTFAQLEGAEKK